jgi:hypothetical protein
MNPNPSPRFCCTELFSLASTVRTAAIAILGVAILLAPALDAHAALVMHLKLDETTGTTASDSSGNGNIGTLTGAGFDFNTFSVPGQFGRALDFNNSGRIDVTNNSGLPSNLSGPFTVAMWLNSGDWDGRDDVLVQYSINGLGFSIGLNVGNGLNFGISSGTNTAAGFTETTTLANNSWAHLAAILNPTGGGIQSVYVNGVLATEDNNVAFGVINPGFFIGARGPLNSQPLEDIMDDFAIYNTALTAEEIQDIMQFGVGFTPVPEPGTLVLTAGAVGVLAAARRRRARRRLGRCNACSGW